MERMREEFCSLKQGKMDIIGYQSEFNRLARYAGDEVSTEAKKMARFRRGFNPELKYALTNVKADNFEDLVNTALNEENGRKMFEESRKHSREGGSSSNTATPTQKRRIWVPESAVTRASHAQTSPGFASRPPNPAQPQRGIMGQPRPPLQRPGVTCFKCGQPGHYSNMCPQQKLPPPPPRPNTNQAMVRAPPPKAFNTNNRPVGKAVRVNHVKVDKAEEAPDVVLGTLPVNSIPAKVLFDTGASHSFVSQLFAEMHESCLDPLL